MRAGSRVAGEPRDRPGRQVADDRVRAVELVERVDPDPGLDPAAALRELGGERGGDRARAAARRPASRTRWQAQISATPTAELIGRFSGLNACAATPPKSALACGVRKARASTVAGIAARSPKRSSRSGCEGRCSTGRTRSSLRTSKERRWAGERPAPRGPVVAESRGRPLDRAHHHPGAAVVERVRQVDLGPAPLEPVAAEVERVVGTASPAAIGCTAEQKSWTRPGTVELAAAGAAAELGLGLEHRHPDPLAGERDRAGEPVGPGADDDRRAHPTGARTGSARAPATTSTGNSQEPSIQGPRRTISATSTQPSSTRPVAAS